MDQQAKQDLISDYISAYNDFDVDGMLETLHPNIVFENFSGDSVTLTTKGLDAFREAAEQAVSIFSAREQTITSVEFEEHSVNVAIAYIATLAMDLPNGLKAGDEMKLSGRSVFRFKDGKISYLADYS